MPHRKLVAIGLVITVVIALVAAWAPRPAEGPIGSPTGAGEAPSVAASSTFRPVPGHEVYGFVPYWEMDDGIAAHLRTTNLTTLALFSVTNTSKGAIDTRPTGYQRVAGAVGEQVVREAHDRGIRVDLVFTSFGLDRNARFFGDRALQDATIASLVRLVGDLRMDGVNADVEALDPLLVPAYGAFVGRLRDAVVAADPTDRVSVSTSANVTGAAMAAAATGAGADRIFLMGYDYRSAGSDPGATSPLARRDGSEKDLTWSLDLYAVAGVPPERTLLGLPLYGMTWPVAGPVLGAPATGNGEAWILRQHLDVLQDSSIVPIRDEIEEVELYVFASGGPSPAPGAADDRDWRAVYVDSPQTLAPKLALANERGLAGAGFWAIGYERGLPGYTDLIARFAAGEAIP